MLDKGWARYEDPSLNRIGCRQFDAATFKKIMAAAQRTQAKAASANVLWERYGNCLTRKATKKR